MFLLLLLLLLLLLCRCHSQEGNPVVDLRPDREQDFLVVDHSMQLDYEGLVKLADSLVCDSIFVQFSLTPEGSDTTYLLSPLGWCKETTVCILRKPRNVLVLSMEAIDDLFASGQLEDELLNHMLNREKNLAHAERPSKAIIFFDAPNTAPIHQVEDALGKLAVAFDRMHQHISNELPFLPFQIGRQWPDPIEVVK